MTSHMWWACCVVLAAMAGDGRNGGGSGMVLAKPIVDPGLFVIQGVSSCRDGDGYCMLGANCSVDVDFLPDDEGGNCAGLREAFTPKIDFSCCRYNPLGKETSEAPTTTLSSVTVTDVFSLIDEEVLQQIQQQQQEEMDYEKLNPENLIDIVGVVTDFTGIVGLVTRPWTGTLPTRAPTTTTSTSTIKPELPSQATPALSPPEEDLGGEQLEITESYHEVLTTSVTPLPATVLLKEKLQTSGDILVTKVFTSNATSLPPTTQNSLETPETTTENRENQNESHQNEDQAGYDDHLILQPVNQNICGFKGPSMPEPSGLSRILGGVTASTLEWCWIAALMERRAGGNKYICSGALIEPDLVLTTATCLRRLDHSNLSNYIVVLGDSDLKDDLPYGIQFHSIVQAVVHPHYYTSGGAHVNDIGLLKLRNPATLTDNVCLMCIARQDASIPASQCVVVGYGLGAFPVSAHNNAYPQTQAFVHNYAAKVVGRVPSEGVLRKLSVPLLGAEECRTVLHNVTGSKILAESNSFLCGGISQGVACHSTLDGGSPLGCEVGGRWFLAGLVSWSRDCSSSGQASIYSRIPAFTGWVQAAYLRSLGFATSPLQTRQIHWIYHHLDKINKEFA
ncbi:hypothetical protein O3P69_002659 [Scylla paramamosain]|uniref:Peptidase S1 domain-containing protein n=1 Tax=Scylla paramamosain TaxID=85552 RepID=A0AAW0ULK8_SCYPA